LKLATCVHDKTCTFTTPTFYDPKMAAETLKWKQQQRHSVQVHENYDDNESSKIIKLLSSVFNSKK